MINWIVTLVYMAVSTYTDIKSRNIYVGFSLLIMWVCIIGNLVCGNLAVKGMIAGIIPGIVLMAVSILSKESVGIGDAIMIAVLGTALGIEKVLDVMVWSFGLLGVMSLTVLIIRKDRKERTIPVAPFILLGECVSMVCHM